VDLVLNPASVFELPPSQRAGAIVYDGTADLGVWRPPGPDRDLLHAYGDSLSSALAKERAQLRGGTLKVGQAIRLHPGKLRCDYLIWVASRAAHGDTEPAPAPALSEIEALTQAALELACKHGTLRVAFGPLGAGRDAADAAERLAAIVRGADAFRAQRMQQGKSVPVEEVLVCAASAADVAKARRLTARLAKAPSAAPVVSASLNARSETHTPRTPNAVQSPSAPRRSSKARKLDPAEIATARVRAAPYDRGRAYFEGEWFIHPTFGAGQVQSVLGPERMVLALFEDGEERRLIHDRP
jgi:O-acetyl-ADP-ribose deacetylase (regulator of RNase III)